MGEDNTRCLLASSNPYINRSRINRSNAALASSTVSSTSIGPAGTAISSSLLSSSSTMKSSSSAAATPRSLLKTRTRSASLSSSYSPRRFPKFPTCFITPSKKLRSAHARSSTPSSIPLRSLPCHRLGHSFLAEANERSVGLFLDHLRRRLRIVGMTVRSFDEVL